MSFANENNSYLGERLSSRPRILAHRGLTFKNNIQVAEENTLQAFELALATGADFIESDIQVTKDDVAVLFHDDDLYRLTGSKAKIADINLVDIMKISLPFGGRIPTLEQTLLEFPKARFNLDIKVKPSEVAGTAVINSLKASSRVLVTSFSDSSRKRALLNLDSPVATSAGTATVVRAYASARSGLTNTLKKQLSGISALQLPIKMRGLDFLHPKFIQGILQTETELHYWTINDPEQMRQLWLLGAHGIVTDRTDLAIQAFS
jgi:glycerophosphoryl diester phosphodiesterase